MTTRRRGRRTSGEDTRAALLEAARLEFNEKGYDGATVRRIAERAGVDAAMVNHWFGGKGALFTASLEVPVDPSALIAAVVAGGPDGVGERLVATFLRVWDLASGGPLITLLRSVASHPAAARMMREFVASTILGPVVRAVSPDRHDERMALVAAQMIGIGLVRYVVELEPLATGGHGPIVAAVGPTVQGYLTGPLGGPVDDPGSPPGSVGRPG
ncbi:TetR family transcriptional regulator [Pseudonocardia sp. WMMC193]|uniref:TetR/AcrR family transcriptional regulator n=1 Tax=Pseudonocardia sp. WMMC193 TaxID=2911965 RepID=UPI001F0321B3|nr:TetR family transcriptional regulator [Pseudonocardia sp. WMMC193]MCF7548425.1 TetR family transcriptional regulator [Pseudonocardia sp. WMMC193]